MRTEMRDRSLCYGCMIRRKSSPWGGRREKGIWLAGIRGEVVCAAQGLVVSGRISVPMTLHPILLASSSGVPPPMNVSATASNELAAILLEPSILVAPGAKLAEVDREALLDREMYVTPVCGPSRIDRLAQGPEAAVER